MPADRTTAAATRANWKVRAFIRPGRRRLEEGAGRKLTKLLAANLSTLDKNCNGD
jgi:hypothetical protein